jgi:hypothetical protein
MKAIASKMLPIVIVNTLIVALTWYAMEPPRLNWGLLALWVAANLLNLAIVKHRLSSS